MGNVLYWWSSHVGSSGSYDRGSHSVNTSVFGGSESRGYGFSVRCVGTCPDNYIVPFFDVLKYELSQNCIFSEDRKNKNSLFHMVIVLVVAVVFSIWACILLVGVLQAIPEVYSVSYMLAIPLFAALFLLVALV